MYFRSLLLYAEIGAHEGINPIFFIFITVRFLPVYRVGDQRLGENKSRSRDPHLGIFKNILEFLGIRENPQKEAYF